MYYVKMILFNSTPRSVYETKYSPVTTEWGTLFPTMTQLVVITFGYSIISPIINGLACAAFFLFYLLYKYLFTWVNDQPHTSETGGLFFPKAMNHIFVGLYVQQLCLCALFFLAQNDKSQPSAIPEGALLIVLIVSTVSTIQRFVCNYSRTTQAFFHDTILSSYGPLLKALPLTLADSSYNRVEPEDHTTADAPKPRPSSSENVKGIDYEDVSPHASHQPDSEGKAPPHNGANGGSLKESPSSPLMKLVKGEGATDFRHPATVEEQRAIWLPEDPFGLVKEIEGDLDSHDILHTTEWAKMDAKGHVDVNLVLPDDA
jgi:calcium permeable stress-gated cation channel